MTTCQWTSNKPKFDTECLLICSDKINDEWEYSIYQIKKVVYDGKWYWGWLDGDGVEIGDIADLKATNYFVMPLVNNSDNPIQLIPNQT